MINVLSYCAFLLVATILEMKIVCYNGQIDNKHFYKRKEKLPYFALRNVPFFCCWAFHWKWARVYGCSYIILICICDDKKRFGTEIIGTYFYIKRSIHKGTKQKYEKYFFYMCIMFLGIRNSWEFIYFYALVVADGKTCRSLKCFL